MDYDENVIDLKLKEYTLEEIKHDKHSIPSQIEELSSIDSQLDNFHIKYDQLVFWIDKQNKHLDDLADIAFKLKIWMPEFRFKSTDQTYVFDPVKENGIVIKLIPARIGPNKNSYIGDLFLSDRLRSWQEINGFICSSYGFIESKIHSTLKVLNVQMMPLKKCEKQAN